MEREFEKQGREKGEKKGKEDDDEKTEMAATPRKRKEKYIGSGIEKDEEKLLKELPYYHGYIPRDDLGAFLRYDGDFLLRITEVDSDKKDGMKQLVISTLASQVPTEKEERIFIAGPMEQLKTRNVVVNRTSGNNRQYRIDEKVSFPSVKEVIQHFMESNHVTKQGVIRLKRGIPLQNWEYTHEELKFGKILGSGQYGEVWEGILVKKKNKKEVKVAIKQGKGQGNDSKEKVKEFMKEARIMKFLRHRNVVRLYGVLLLEQPIGIILELVDGGGLDSYLREHEINVREKTQMCCGAANGLSYLHSEKIIHRDIAARNCLYNSEKIVKISDFGLSRVIEKGESEYKIKHAKKFPIKWLAPETIAGLVFSAKSDVYSFGVLVWEIFSNGKEPFVDERNTDVKIKITSGNFLQMPAECPQKLSDFISTRIFVLDRQKRISMGDTVRFLEVQVMESKIEPLQIELAKTQRMELKSNSKELLPDELLIPKKPSTLTARPGSKELLIRKAEGFTTETLDGTGNKKDKKSAHKKKILLHKSKFVRKS